MGPNALWRCAGYKLATHRWAGVTLATL